LQIYKKDYIDLLVPANRGDKAQLTICEDVTGGGGIKVSSICAPLQLWPVLYIAVGSVTNQAQAIKGTD